VITMPPRDTFVIAGGGLAAAGAAEALRGEGFDGRIVLAAEEPHLPYERPPLSKDYLRGASDREKIFVHDAGWYHDHDIELQPGVAVTAVDPGDHQVTLSDGARLAYTKLLLATGAAPRRLTVPGADQDLVHYLRTVEDCERLRTTLAGVTRIAIIGAGWIGLEVAAAARADGVEVTVLETERQPLLRVLGPTIAAVFADLHRAQGVDLRLGVQVTEVVPGGVRLADGTRVDAEAVLVGIGATPNTGLAEAAGLAVDNGVQVGADLRTTDPDIFAAGDVANAYHPLLGTHIRVEHWANALNQPAVAARGMLGRDAAYDRLPYFYTDQYDLGMEYSGHVRPGRGDDVVIRGDVGSREFIAFWLDDDRPTAAMNVNIWDVTGDLQNLIRAGKPVDRVALTDPAVPLEQTTRPR
jgi:3-phenylpropionate/trans-cinnamate dioxygenase ferredoxin reductase subunit